MAGEKIMAFVGLLLLSEVLAATAPPPKSAKQPPPRTDRFGDPLPAGAVARIGTVRWWCGRIHGEWVNSLVYTPDGKSLVFSGDRDTVHFLDAATGKEQRRIVVPEVGRRACFALAPNGKTLVTANLGSPVFHVWDVPTGKELRRIQGVKRGVDALAFTPDGKTFAVGTHTDIWLWDTATWKEMRRIEGKDVGHYGGIFFLADGKTLLSGFSNRISWWDTSTGRLIRRISRDKYDKEGGFSHLALSADGKRIAVVLYRSSNLLLVWDAVTGKEVRRIELGEKISPSCLCFSPDSRILACSGGDNSRDNQGHQTRFFAAGTGQELHRWDEGDYHANQMAFSPDVKILAQAMYGVIRLRDVKSGKPIMPLRGLPNSCLAVCFTRDGKALIAGCRGGRIGTSDPLTGESLTPLHNPPEGFGRQAAPCQWTYSAFGGPPPKGFGRQSAPSVGMALTAHGERAALVNAEGVLHIWEPATGKVCCRIAEPKGAWDQAYFSPDGKMVIAKHRDDIIRLWDARAGKLLRALPRTGRWHTPQPCAFSPDGRTLAVGPARLGNDIHFYETATGKEEGRFAWRDKTEVNRLLFTPDGNYLLAAHRSSTLDGEPPPALRLWDRDSGRDVRRIRMMVYWDKAMAISPDGKTVAVSNGDNVVLWELASGRERGRFRGHRERIRSLAFSPDGRLLASGSYDHTALVWDVSGICPDGKWSPRRVKPDELERLWTDLGHTDGVRAYRALWRLAAAGPSTIALLAQRLRPAPRVKEEKLTRLIADLDSDRFEKREHASAELQRLSEQAEAALRKALAAKPSLEAARRLRALLDRVEKRTLSAEQLHTLRALEVLEHIGSPEARQVLQTLAHGAPEAMRTREAKAALGRLRLRSNPAP